MTPAGQGLHGVLGHIGQRVALHEQCGAGRGPWLTLAGVGATRAHLQCFTASGLDKLALLLVEDDEQLDAGTLVAFGAPASATPHLYIDVAKVGRDYVVFADLLPRVELGCQRSYVSRVYQPLFEAFDEIRRDERLAEARLPHVLRAFASPWMVGLRVQARHLALLFEHITPYVERWETLLHEGVRVEQLGSELVVRDAVYRSGLFNKDIDPAWQALAAEVGAEGAGFVLELLSRHGVPVARSLRPRESLG